MLKSPETQNNSQQSELEKMQAVANKQKSAEKGLLEQELRQQFDADKESFKHRLAERENQPPEAIGDEMAWQFYKLEKERERMREILELAPQQLEFEISGYHLLTEPQEQQYLSADQDKAKEYDALKYIENKILALFNTPSNVENVYFVAAGMNPYFRMEVKRKQGSSDFLIVMTQIPGKYRDLSGLENLAEKIQLSYNRIARANSQNKEFEPDEHDKIGQVLYQLQATSPRLVCQIKPKSWDIEF